MKTAGDVQNALKELFPGVLQEIMEAELETHLDTPSMTKRTNERVIAETGKCRSKQ